MKIAGLTQTIAKKSDFHVGAIHVALADRRVLPLPCVVLNYNKPKCCHCEGSVRNDISEVI